MFGKARKFKIIIWLTFITFNRNIQDDLVIFSYSSISWLSGVISLVSALLINRATRIVTNEKFSPKSFGEIVKKYKVTTSICSTQVATELLGSITFDSNDFKSIKEMFLGGERVPSAAREFMKSNFPTGSFNVAYGTTECGLLSKLEGKFDSSRINANVVGIANTNGQIKIVDVSSRQPLGVKEAGEVLAKTETMFSVRFQVSLNFDFYESFISTWRATMETHRWLIKLSKRTTGIRPVTLGS